MNRRFLPLVAIVLIPVLVLAGFAWRGVQAQRRAAWADKREEAQRLTTTLAAEATRLLQEQHSFPLLDYPDPPLPQSSEAASRRLDAARRVEDLRVIRNDPDAGLTSTGLPIRALAAAMLLEKENTPANTEALVTLALREVPSVLTSSLLMAAEKRGVKFETPWQQEWQRVEQSRDLATRHPQVQRGWVSAPDGPWWFNREAKRYIPPAALHATQVGELTRNLPIWARLRFRVSGIREFPDEPLAQIPLTDFPGLSLQVIAPDASLVETSVRSQERWAFAMVGISLLTATIGLVLMQRTLARERRLNELKGHFVASVSHELRAPVASIRLMADALDAGKVSTQAVGDFHRLISREGKRLSNLIENVLDFARIDQGRKRWHFEPCDLPALVADTVKLMEPLAAEKKIALAYAPSDFPHEPAVDAEAIQQTLINLLDNAIKFSPEETSISISLASDHSSWSLAVRDEGPGILSSEHSKIFERFYRPGDELRRESQGTGIGLSLVRAIAEAHGGKVLLESQPDHGSTFTLHIPHRPPQS